MHTIRLTEAWVREPTGRFCRRFHWVARLEPDEQVWLVFREVRGDAEVLLNDRIIGRVAPSGTENRLLINEFLKPTNVLVLLPCQSGTSMLELSQIVSDICLTVCDAPL